VALRRNFSGPVCSTDPVKVSKDTASLLVRTRKKFFAWGLRDFCEWHHKRRTFRPPWPTLPGPGRQPLGGSISLKFLLETRLQSESFDTLDDLLGFRVQKLWCETLWPSGWAIGQATWAKMTLKLLHLWCQSQKIRTPQPQNFFQVQSTRLADLFDSLNSSLVQSAEELGRW